MSGNEDRPKPSDGAARAAPSTGGSRPPLPREIIEAAAKGDPRACRAIFDDSIGPIMSFCLIAANRDRELARDLSQDVFARVFESLHMLKDTDQLRSWMFVIANNICRSLMASAAHRQPLLDAFLLEIDCHLAKDDARAREARIDMVTDTLDKIEDEQLRTIVKLRYTEPEHTTREIALKLGVPHGTVTVTLMRFRALVKDVLAEALAKLGGDTNHG